MKKYFLLMLCMMFLLTSLFAQPSVETQEPTQEEIKDPFIVVYAEVPDSWEYPCVWAWDENGVSAFTSWPGDLMEPDSSNPGWYYIYVPSTMKSVIINANDGSVQTSDYSIDGANAWIKVKEDGTATVSKVKMTTGEIPMYTERYTVFVQVDESWSSPCLWAWEDPSGKNAFAPWPGRKLKPNANGWYSAKVPSWCNCIIINGNEGTVQTEDIKDLDPANMWVTVNNDGSFDLTYEDPTIPKVADITVKVTVPEEWENPCVWAWSHPDGTNAFLSWPGEEMEKGEDGTWTLSVPGWINSIIINANDGTVQTTDLRVDSGKDLAITVESADNAIVNYL